MSTLPPYQYPPDGGYRPYDPYTLARPGNGAGRGAGILQVTVAALGLLLAFCMLGAVEMLARGVFTPEQREELLSIAGSQESLKTVLITFGACAGVPSLILLILGMFVWRGARWAMISSIVVTSLLLLVGGAGIAMGMAGGRANLEQACTNVVPLLVLGALLAAQIRALVASAPGRPSMMPPQQWQQGFGPLSQGPSGQLPPPSPGGEDNLPPPPVPPARPGD